VLVDTGAVAELEQRITVLVDEAVGSLAAAPITAPARLGLTELAYAVGWREK
jgi:hypothetical protein